MAIFFLAFQSYIVYTINDKEICHQKGEQTKMYTMENWEADRYFNAEPGQEITPEIYDAMLNGVPPKTLPTETAMKALEEYNVPVHAGFLMGEPDSDDSEGRALYLAFGMSDYGNGKHYFYLGLSPAIRSNHIFE